MHDHQIFSTILLILGSLGILTFLSLAAFILWYYRECPGGSFRWHLRNASLRHVSALACLFCLAMAASYLVLFEIWAMLYLIIAFKAGSWWLRISMTQRA
ncbi:hypothetical protein [Tengunoibacter tsumagoiensis]|uniref:Uncharacterized protein n=1 Tax=Tengunoibacter tsumagoiensis TaxID=2014871 RepID=A0A402A1K9_9CHLR|nr:hypothetical protein [Tengunoibacter tsumagoiensis]GCE13023.1 hypothetical protein KTT_28820 [Tengunoibacter tsumagoiensis]